MITILSPLLAVMMIAAVPNDIKDLKEIKEIKEVVELEYKEDKEILPPAVKRVGDFMTRNLGFPPNIPPTTRPLSE